MAIQIRARIPGVSGRGFSGGGPVQASPNAFGAQSANAQMELGAQMARTGAQIAGVLEKRNLERVSTGMLEQENKLREAYRNFDSQYRSEKQGKNALSATDDYRNFLDSTIPQFRSTISDPRVMADFERRVAAFRSGVMDHAASYQLAEENRWKTDTLSARGTETFAMAADPNVADDVKFASFEDYQKLTAALFPGVKEGKLAADQETFRQEMGKSYLARFAAAMQQDAGKALALADDAISIRPTIRRGGGEGGDTAEPRGIRNNNPGNIRISGRNAWQGAVPGDDTEFVTFATPEHGIRAMGRLLTNYDAQGVNTVEDIISRWAPRKENDTAAYVKRVAGELGVSPTEPLNVRDAETLTKLTRAIISHENGKNPYSDEQIVSGVMAALGGKSQRDEALDLAAYIPAQQLAAMREQAKTAYKKQSLEAITERTSAMPPTEAVDWIIKNVPNAEIQSAAISVQQQRQSRDDWQKRQDLNNRLADAYDSIRTTAEPVAAQAIIDTFPPEEQGKLKTVADRHFSGELTITDKAKMGEFLTRLANGDTNINLKAEYGAYFSDMDMAGAEKKLADGQTKNRTISASQLFESYATNSGMKDANDRKRAKAIFIERVDQENAVTDKDQKRILFDMFREVNFEDGGFLWFDKKMPAWKARELAVRKELTEEQMESRLQVVPASEAKIRPNVRAEIVRQLRAGGRDVTEANVRAVFDRYREEMGWM